MRPFVSPRAAFITQVLPLDGRLAVVTRGGIDWLDPALQLTSRTELPKEGGELAALGEGRLLWHSGRFGKLHVGTEQGPWEEVRIGGEEYASGTLVTPEGFLAWTPSHLLVDVRGRRQEHSLDLVLFKGATRWGARRVLATFETLFVLSPEGVVAHPLRCTGAPATVGETLYVPTEDGEVVALDATLREVDRLPGKQVLAWGPDVVTLDEGQLVVVHDGEAVSFAVPDVSDAHPCGEVMIVGSWEAARAWVFDRSRWGSMEEQTSRPLPGRLRRAATLGGGVVCTDAVSSVATWWRADGSELALPHDFTPNLLVGVPGGVVTTDENVLYLWRPGEDGPEVLPGEGPPLGERLVVQGSTVVVKTRGRFASRGVVEGGAARRVPNDAPWRRACDAQTARALVDRLLARDVEGALPAMPGQPMASTAFSLTQQPVDENYALQSRALFARDRLSDDEQFVADITRSTWLGELAGALGMSARALLGAVNARQFPLKAPKDLPGFEYVGSFHSSGTLVAADPCHFGKKSPADGFLTLSLRIGARTGTWHAYVRQGTGEDADRTAELLVSHADGLGVAANALVGRVGVDAGFVGIYDAGCPKPEPQYDEGVFRGKGAHASSGIGDGHYPVFTGSTEGQVTKVRAWFLGPGAPELDASVLKAGSRKYAPKERFEVGETLEHPTFGSGIVTRTVGDGKIEVLFGETVRVLVHRRG